MSQWSERFKDHAIWKTLQELGPVLDQAIAREGNDENTSTFLSRLKLLQAFTGRRLAEIDGYLLTPAPLDAINGALTTITTEVQNFIANGNPGHITNAIANCDGYLPILAQLNFQSNAKEFQAAQQAADSYRQALEVAISSSNAAAERTRAEQARVQAAYTDFLQALENEKAKLSSVAAEYQGQFSATQDARNKEFSEGQQQRLDAATRLLADYTQRLTDQNAASDKRLGEIETQHQDGLAKLTDEYVTRTDEIRDQILARKSEVEKLVGVIGNLGVTAGYQRSANTALFTSRVWQGLTVTALLGLVGLAFFAFLPLVQGTFSWSSFAGRVYVSLTVAVLAAYSASQADRYQKMERHNRRLALELEAIGPFIAPLPIEKQEQFRLTIGERSFGQPDETPSVNAKSPATMVDLLLRSKEFRSFITDLVKAAKD